MATSTVIPSGYTGLTGMSIDGSYPITRAYTDSSSTNYCRFNVTASTTGYVYFTFDTSDIPSDATNISITGQFKARVSNTTRVSNTGAQLYAGTTAKGTSVAFGSTTASVRSLTPGTSWSKADLNDLRLYVTGRASSSTSSKRIDFYGADVTITYSTSTPTDTAYIKRNNQWVTVTKVFKKVNNSWVEQSDLSNVFDSGTNYYTEQ